VTADRLTPLVDPAEHRLLARGAGLRVPGSRAGLSGELQMAGVDAGPATTRLLVVAAVPTADLDHSRRVLRTLMLVLLPLFLTLLGAVAWRVIGSALRPVESLRQGAQRIGAAADPTERLPVPQTRDEVSALATTLNSMLARLAAAGAQQRSFVADAAHELRSPLASMRTQLEVAARVGEGGALPGELLPEVVRLSVLVEDLLMLARSGADGALAAAAELSVAQLVADTERRYVTARVPVVSKPSSGPRDATVLARPDDLTRAIGNLVDNAVRHAATRVILSWERRDESVWLVVTDDGHGIAEADRERVFHRFARLDEARDRDSGGSGLGLAITRELLRRNGAHVWFEGASPGVSAVVAFERGAPVRSAGD
jgi:signal transduction histidine kinase